jgi:hypothetical protein
MRAAGVAKRVKLVKVSDDMRHLCALIEGELLQWPEVTTRPMFGFRACYRKGVIFALLPWTRALETPESIAYKLTADGASEREKWMSYETHGPESVRSALALLDQAYGAAGQKRERSKKAKEQSAKTQSRKAR